jgi:hypothetical protein
MRHNMPSGGSDKLMGRFFYRLAVFFMSAIMVMVSYALNNISSRWNEPSAILILALALAWIVDSLYQDGRE